MNSVHLLDSVSEITPTHAGCIVVTGSHGGASAGRFAAACRPVLIVFNDAGVGKDRAGVAALAMLDANEIEAATVSHNSARIGDAADTLANGIISHTNRAAARFRLHSGARLADLLPQPSVSP